LPTESYKQEKKYNNWMPYVYNDNKVEYI